MHADGRSKLPFAALLSALLAAFAATPLYAAQPSKGAGGAIAPGPDIEAAVKSEYERAAAKGTREAYQRFIRRHPDHPLADKARDTLAKGNAK